MAHRHSRKPSGPPQVFVAYSYRLYPGPEYREVFGRVGKDCGVSFAYADTRITNEQILDKIQRMIQESAYSVFDISDWNPNVTLELGIARGSGRPWYILIDPSKSTGSIHEAPADLRGFDRVQYSDFDGLEVGLRKLASQANPAVPRSLTPRADGAVTLLDEVLGVIPGSHNEAHFELPKGAEISVFARELEGEEFDLYIMDRRNYVKFCKDRSESDLVAVTNESVVDFKKRIPRDGTWHIVLEAFGKVKDRRVALEIRARPPPL
jgi:hypothetical protein